MTGRPKPTVQPSAVSHTTVGEIVVSVVNDGVFQISFDDVVGVPRAAVEAAQIGEFRIAPPWLTINTFLIQTPGEACPCRHRLHPARRHWSADSSPTSPRSGPGRRTSMRS